ncbi:hypothetical protein ATL17_1635 [Maritalea mobilis]|uniref:PIN domain-containing protein n=1 Tax=Maritalea mobilis TaxID=483324 RepID=A0A4R6VJF0_9HYPH|nr:hypothetical protein ATL17_1635 [Maritalea mobilis]
MEVLIEPCVVQETWFLEIYPELVRCKNIVLICSEDDQSKREMTEAALKRYAEFRRLKGRSKVVSREDVEPIRIEICNNDEFEAHDACDDPHIFAISLLCGVFFVFTRDERMGRCKAAMQGSLSPRHRRFIPIVNQNSYRRHRRKMFSHP